MAECFPKKNRFRGGRMRMQETASRKSLGFGATGRLGLSPGPPQTCCMASRKCLTLSEPPWSPCGNWPWVPSSLGCEDEMGHGHVM